MEGSSSQQTKGRVGRHDQCLTCEPALSIKGSGRKPDLTEPTCAPASTGLENACCDSLGFDCTSPPCNVSSLPKPHVRLPDFTPSDNAISFLDLMHVVLDQSEAVHVGLNSFFRSSLRPQSRTVDGAVPSTDMWPCPVPKWRWTGPTGLSPARRRRRKFLQVRSSLLQKVITILNWEALGHPTCAPSHACVGYPFSDDQWMMICRLERLIDYYLRPGPVTSQSLGRSGEKFANLMRAAQELPACQEVDLFDVVSSIAQDLDSYSSKPSRVETPSCEPHSDCITTAKCELPKSTAKPVVAARIKWEHSPQFDPVPFFTDPVVREAFVDPSRVRIPSDQWPCIPRGKVHCSREELLFLATKWDSKQACKIFRVDEINFDESVGLFAVPKDDVYDRLILNPQTANSRMQKFSHFTKELAPGAMFALICLQGSDKLRISADDLAEMYYTIKIPEKRAKRNSIGMIFRHHELQHLQCFDSSKHFGDCVIALNALAMGDSWAVEFAQQSHHNVLRFLAGAMLEHQRVAYRKPFPRSRFLERLSIDDHVGVQICSPKEYSENLPLRDAEVFSRSEDAYLSVGLVQHPKKKQRGVSEGIFLGAEVNGDLGFVSAPRHRIGALTLCTILVARQGTASPRLLSSLLGCWIHILMFRRPILAILSHSFSEGHGLPQDRVFCLSRECRNELLALCWLAPVCISDIRVDFAPKLYCTDASPDGAGICVSDEDPSVVAELWRHSEQRGYYTQLLNPAAALLHEHDESFEDPCPVIETPQPLDSVIRIPSSLSEGVLYDCIELFRGEGNWSLAHESLGFRVHPGIDVKGLGLAFADMLDDSVYHQIVSLAARGVCRDWHAGPPCYTYGTLRRPRIRSKHSPAGFNLADPLTREQTLLALRTAFVMNLVMLSGLFFSVEQPGSSVMFYLDIFKRMVFRGAWITRMCFCAFGSPFKKPSQWLHNKPWMYELEQPCRCLDKTCHFVIEGTFTRASTQTFESMCKPSSREVYGRAPRVGEAVSAYSASYPRCLCSRIASGAAQATNDSIPLVPLSAHVLSLKRIGYTADIPSSISKEQIADPRPFHQDPEWIEELADSLPFRELLRYKFKKKGHINVLECRVHKTWLKHCAKHHPNSRVLALLDSRVTLGATSKGRSSSRALCRVLQGSLGYILGGGLYPGGLHICSSKNRSDGPSRNRPVPPRSKDLPSWLLALRRQDSKPFDLVLTAARFTKIEARWMRIFLLLGGDIEPNPGPPRRRVEPRGPLDMTVGFAPATSGRMSACVAAFEKWLWDELHISLSSLAWDYVAAPLALRAYGMFLFSSGAPRYRFVYTITGLQDAYPHLRPFFTGAWQVDRKWQQFEPGSCRPVLSGPVMQAICSIALLWDWHRWLGITLIGFLGMLHPSEMINLYRSDLLLPSDTLVDEPVFYVFIRHPKTVRFARRQHCKIDDPVALAFVTKVFKGLSPSTSLFPGGTHAYRSRWNSVLSRLSIPVSQRDHGCTPAVLRGSGATHMFMTCEDLPRVQWRGRWAQQKTLEFYIQEVGAQSMLSKLPPAAHSKVKALADSSTALMSQFLSG